MLTRIEGIQVAVPDRARAARGWIDLLGAESAGEDRLEFLNAKRSRYRLGEGFLDLLEPDGAGPLAKALAARGGAHLFAAGAACSDLEALCTRLRERRVAPIREAGQLYLVEPATADHGLRVVVSQDEVLPAVGALDGFYEVTNLVSDAKKAVGQCSALFGLDPQAFVPIESAQYGYAGMLTLFHPDRLHRFEIITPYAGEKTMGRFFHLHGECLYMAFAESPNLAAIAERARERGVGHSALPSQTGEGTAALHTLFLHPDALGGVMLGLSRPDFAWVWSGRPDRVRHESGRA